MATIAPRERDLADPPDHLAREGRLRRDGVLPPTSVGRVRVRTLPTDIDFLGHMNNGRYASLFDLGRFDLLIRTGDVGPLCAHAAGTPSWRARRSPSASRSSCGSASPSSRGCSVMTTSPSYLIHRAVVDGEVYAEMIVRARFLRRSGGIVPLEELFEALHRPDDLPELEPWVRTGPRRPPCRRPRAPRPASGADGGSGRERVRERRLDGSDAGSVCRGPAHRGEDLARRLARQGDEADRRGAPGPHEVGQEAHRNT